MSRIAKAPIEIPSSVEVKIAGQNISIKGAKGAFDYVVHSKVSVSQEGSEIKVGITSSKSNDFAMAGTMRSLLNNMVQGVSQGFRRKLELVGVGYRAQVQGKKLNLTLGFSHPVEYAIPEGIAIETPSQTEIVVTGIDKQKVGQTAADIRAYRPPEPYKGKGVKYSGEHIVRKEAKKK